MFAARVLIALLGVALMVPASAAAHVRVLPEEAAANTYTVLDVNVPNESADLATRKVVLEFPPGFAYALYQPVAGWSVEVKMAKAAKPAIGGQTIPEHVSRVTWTARSQGAEIQPEQIRDFSIGVQIPGQTGETLTFKALQTYADGDVVRWTGGPNSASPAPQVRIGDGPEEQAGAATESTSSEEDSGGGGEGLAIAALIVAILGLLAAATALVLSLRRAGKIGHANEGSEMATQTKLITGTDFITVATQDYERAAEFYGETLGLEFSKGWGSMPAGEFETGNLTIAVMQSDAFGIEFRANNHPIEFHVEDFEGAKAELEARGIEFRGDTLDSGVCHQAFFADPDGNTLAIHHRYAPPEAGPSV